MAGDIAALRSSLEMSVKVFQDGEEPVLILLFIYYFQGKKGPQLSMFSENTVRGSIVMYIH
jgi:hypothetical protein